MKNEELRGALVRELSDRYAVDPDALGVGGMAVVFGALDLRHDRRVAIKLLRPEQWVAYGTDRFLREINLTARLQHPHVLPLLDSGSITLHGMKLPYYVMPLVVGRTLRSRLDADGPMPVGDALAVARDVADGLQHAHDQGLIHRDIKPENILLNESGAALIADFGVARGIGPGSDPRLTEHDVSLGTPAYMSPEQLFDPAAVGPATDQYSLAAMIFEMVAGRPAFVASSPEALIARRATESPPPLTTLRPDVSAGFDRVLQRGLERKPGDRYPSVRHLIEALERPDAQPVGIVRSMRRPARAVAVAAALVVMIAMGWWWGRRPARVVSGGAMIVLADVENLTADSTLGPALRIAAGVGLQQSSSFSVYPRSRLEQSLARMGRTIRDTVISEALAREIALREGGRAVVVMTVAEIGGRYTLATRIVDPFTGNNLTARQLEVDTPADLLPANGKLVDWTRRTLGDPNSGRARPLPMVTTGSLAALQTYAEARAAYGRGQWEQTQRLLDHAIELDTGFAMAQAFLGELLIYTNDVPGALRWLREADRRTPRLTEVERLNVKAQLAEAEGRKDAWIDLTGELANRFPSAAHWNDYGEALRLADRPREAIAALERGMAIDSTSPDLLYDLAIANRDAGNHTRALELFSRIARIDSAYMLTAFAPQEWGRTQLETGDLAGAEATFRRLLDAPGAAERARGHRLLAYLALYRGRYAEAAAELRLGIPLWRAGSLSEYRDQVLLAHVELTRGNSGAARAALDRVVAIFRETTIQAAAVMFGGHQLVQAGQLDRGRLLLDSLTARAALRPDADQDRAALMLLSADLALAEGRLDAAAEALRSAPADDYEVLWLDLVSELHAARDQRDSAVVYAQRATKLRPFGYEMQTDWLASFGQLARLAEAAGNVALARAAYTDLIALWRDGDADLPPLVSAKRELLRLQRATSR